MNNKFIYASLASALVGFLLGWLIFGIVLMNFYDTYTIKYPGLMLNPPILWAIALANLCWGMLFTYIFQKWANINSFGKGFMGAMVITFLIVLSFDVSLYGFMHLFAKRVLVVDVVANTLLGGAMGGVAAWVLGYGKKEVA